MTTSGTLKLEDAMRQRHGPGDRSRPAFSWPEPKPVPEGLLPVMDFDPAFMPNSLAPWVADISDRMQCPPDFVGVSAVTSLGSVIGRKMGVRPQRRTDWTEVPNVWGCIVGRPGAMKSPAMAEAMKPLHRLEAEARKRNEEDASDYEVELEAHKLRKEAAQKDARAALKSGGNLTDILSITAPEEPKPRRYIVNDSTYESLGEVLADNPIGVLAFRDELVSLLRTLDREEYAAARGFFLTAWNGTAGYTFDRIARGRTHIPAACISMLGSTQPGRLSEYMRRALAGGAGDDGLIQRFALLVWPDQSPTWQNVDQYPDSAARETAWNTFTQMDTLAADQVGAQADTFDALPFLRFDEDAQGLFEEWRRDLEARLRTGDLHPALESHLAKYRKLVPGLSLLNHLADGGAGPIVETAVLRALSFAEYLESHARRAYGAGSEAESSSAKAVLSRIRRGDLQDRFTARDIHQRAWSNLTDRQQVQAGLDLLCDLDWLAQEPCQTGGRPKVLYRINPRGHQ